MTNVQWACQGGISGILKRNSSQVFSMDFNVLHHKQLFEMVNSWYYISYQLSIQRLDQARTTRGSRATCCPQYSVTCPAKTFEVRKNLVTLSLAKPRYNTKEIYVWRLTLQIHFVKM
jgi:hypothetical protein